MATIDVWLSLSMYAHANPLFVEERLVARHITWLSVLGRLAGGVTPARAQAEREVLAQRLAKQHPTDVVSVVCEYLNWHSFSTRTGCTLGLGTFARTTLPFCA